VYFDFGSRESSGTQKLDGQWCAAGVSDICQGFSQDTGKFETVAAEPTGYADSIVLRVLA
jgi:hypothetical protein